MRTCTKCNREKEINLFQPNFRNGKNWYYHICRECFNERRRKDGAKTGPYAVHKDGGRSCTKYKNWRKCVLEKDNYKCIECGQKKYLHCDHIVPWKDNEKLRFDISNGQTLCAACHLKKGRKNKEIDGIKTQFKKGRIPWHKGTKGKITAWNKGKSSAQTRQRDSTGRFI